MHEHEAERRAAEHLKARLSSAESLQLYVEEQLDLLVRRPLVAWRMAHDLEVVQDDELIGRWSWEALRRSDDNHGSRVVTRWHLKCAGRENVDLYYDLRASPPLGAFVLVHGNFRRGLFSAGWLVHQATVIEFGALLVPAFWSGDQVSSLARWLERLIARHPPNYDWPT